MATSTSTTADSPKTMKAVVFHGPKHVKLEQRPVPQAREEGDVLVKVGYTALCGRCVYLYFSCLSSPLRGDVGRRERGKSEWEGDERRERGKR